MRSIYLLPIALIVIVVAVIATIVMLPPPEDHTPGENGNIISQNPTPELGQNDNQIANRNDSETNGQGASEQEAFNEPGKSGLNAGSGKTESPTGEADPGAASTIQGKGDQQNGSGGVSSATGTGGDSQTQAKNDSPLNQSIRGMVQDTKGFALYNVTVEVAGYDSVVTKSDGRFQLKGIKEDTVTVIASREGYHTLKKSGVEVGSQLTLTLVPEGVLAGRVVDQRNEPVSSARVSLKAQEGIWVSDIYAGPEGRFQVSDAPASPIEITASQDGFSNEGEGRRVVKPPFAEEVVLRLHQPTYSISGRVVMKGDEQGVKGFSLVARLQDSESDVEPMVTTTSSNGQYSFNDLVRGSYMVSSNAPENTHLNVVIPVDQDYKSVRVHEADVRHINFEAVGGRTIRGQVVTQGGQPVSNAEVSIAQFRSANTTTNSDGSFTLIGGPVLTGNAPSYLTLQLYASHPEYGVGMSEPLPRQSSEGEIEGIVITLAGTSTLQGQVVTPDGNGVSEARIVLRDLINGSVKETVTDGSGGFVIEEIAASEKTIGTFRGTHQLLVQKEGYADQQEEIMVKPGQAQNITITLYGGSVISGNISDSNGEPLQGVQVKALNARGLAGTVVSDEYGQYQFNNLRDGQYDLLFRLETNPPMTGSRYQVSTGSQNVDVTLIPGEWIIMGTVFNTENQQFLTNYQVTLQGRPDGAQGRMFVKSKTFNTPDGTYRLRLTEPGTYTLTVSAEGYHPQEYPQRIGPGAQTIQLQNAYLEPLSNTGTISGSLILPDGMQLVGVEVLGIKSVPSAGNSFTIEDVPAGDHNLLFIVRSEDFQAGEPVGVYPSVTVAPDQTTNLRQIVLQQLQRAQYRGF